MLEKLGEDASDERVKTLFTSMDVDRDGSINFFEFMSRAPPEIFQGIERLQKNLQQPKLFRATSSKRGLNSGDKLRKVRKLFAECDTDGNGSIDPDEMAELLRRLGHNFTHEQVMDLMKMMDNDGNGSISFLEFLNGAPDWLLESFDEENDKRLRSSSSGRRMSVFSSMSSNSLQPSTSIGTSESESESEAEDFTLKLTDEQLATILNLYYGTDAEGRLIAKEFDDVMEAMKSIYNPVDHIEHIRKYMKVQRKSEIVFEDFARCLKDLFQLTGSQLEAIAKKGEELQMSKDRKSDYNEWKLQLQLKMMEEKLKNAKAKKAALRKELKEERLAHQQTKDKLDQVEQEKLRLQGMSASVAEILGEDGGNAEWKDILTKVSLKLKAAEKDAEDSKKLLEKWRKKYNKYKARCKKLNLQVEDLDLKVKEKQNKIMNMIDQKVELEDQRDKLSVLVERLSKHEYELMTKLADWKAKFNQVGIDPDDL